MSNLMVWRWVQIFFNEEYKNVHNDEQSGWLSSVNENMMHATEEKIMENRSVTMTLLSLYFSHCITSIFSWNCIWEAELFEIVEALLVQKMLMEEYKVNSMRLCCFFFYTI